MQSCIGLKFSIIEIKMFIFVLVTSFKFAESDKVGKANVCVPYSVPSSLIRGVRPTKFVSAVVC